MRACVLGLMLVLSAVPPAAADPVTLAFTGGITNATSFAEPLIGIAAEPGDRFSLSVRFVPPTDTDPRPSFGTYPLSGDLELKVGADRFVSAYTATAYTVDYESSILFENRFSIGIYDIREEPDFLLDIEFPVSVSGRWLTSDALPLSQADWDRLAAVSDTPHLGYLLSYTPGGGELFSVLDGSIDRVSVNANLAPVPEPATLILLSTGLVTAFVCRSRGRGRVLW